MATIPRSIMMAFHCMVHVVQLRMNQLQAFQCNPRNKNRMRAYFWIRVGVVYRVMGRNDRRYRRGLLVHRALQDVWFRRLEKFTAPHKMQCKRWYLGVAVEGGSGFGALRMVVRGTADLGDLYPLRKPSKIPLAGRSFRGRFLPEPAKVASKRIIRGTKSTHI